MPPSPAMDPTPLEVVHSSFASELTTEEKHVFGQTTLSDVLQTLSEMQLPVIPEWRQALLNKLTPALDSIERLAKVLEVYLPDCSGYIWVIVPQFSVSTFYPSTELEVLHRAQ